MSEVKMKNGNYEVDGYTYHIDSGGQVYRETCAGDIHGQTNRVFVGSTLGRRGKDAVIALHRIFLAED